MEDVDKRQVSLPNKNPYSPEQCAWAMARLMERLVEEGYIQKHRIKELLERAWNQERGPGFFTNAELAERGTTSIPTPEEELLS